MLFEAGEVGAVVAKANQALTRTPVVPRTVCAPRPRRVGGVQSGTPRSPGAHPSLPDPTVDHLDRAGWGLTSLPRVSAEALLLAKEHQGLRALETETTHPGLRSSSYHCPEPLCKRFGSPDQGWTSPFATARIAASAAASAAAAAARSFRKARPEPRVSLEKVTATGDHSPGPLASYSNPPQRPMARSHLCLKLKCKTSLLGLVAPGWPTKSRAPRRTISGPSSDCDANRSRSQSSAVSSSVHLPDQKSLVVVRPLTCSADDSHTNRSPPVREREGAATTGSRLHHLAGRPWSPHAGPKFCGC
mmetsp:Transcript_51340/g.109162  ORF Transcript_51340/g.109162 Transcript_51340/m.109162 type:complete len:303 (-) Transcript_51340:2665-3573(-)